MELEDAHISDRDIIIQPRVRQVDKHGRIYVGREHAGKEGVLVMVGLKEGDKGKFQP
jgi:hypothetical protein